MGSSTTILGLLFVTVLSFVSATGVNEENSTMKKTLNLSLWQKTYFERKEVKIGQCVFRTEEHTF